MRQILRSLFLFGVLAVFLFLGWLFRGPILIALGEFLVVQDPLRPAASIVVLSGESPARVLRGWELYKQGYAPMILLTQTNRSPAESEMERQGVHYPGSSELDRKALIELNTPAQSITLIEPRADSTFTEAILVKSFFGKQPPERLLLVTSRYHSRRARTTFRHVFGKDTEILSAPTPYDGFNPDGWWKNRNNIRNLVLEYQKGLLYGIMILWDRINPWKTKVVSLAAPIKE